MSSCLRCSRGGFTLAELLVSMFVSSLVLAGVFSVFIGLQRGTYATSDVMATKSRLELAEQQLALDLRNTQNVITSTPTLFRIKVRYYNDDASTTREVSYEYDSSAHAIVRTEDGNRRPIVRGIEGATFKYYQRKMAGSSIETLAPSAVNAISVLVTPSLPRAYSGSPDNRQYTLATFQLRRISFP